METGDPRVVLPAPPLLSVPCLFALRLGGRRARQKAASPALPAKPLLRGLGASRHRDSWTPGQLLCAEPARCPLPAGRLLLGLEQERWLRWWAGLVLLAFVPGRSVSDTPACCSGEGVCLRSRAATRKMRLC